MRKYILIIVLLWGALLMTPLVSVEYKRIENSSVDSEYNTTFDTIKVMSSENGFIRSIEIREYLIGCVAGEMPVSYHSEALKAQTVACYTYAKYISKRDADILGGADISDDSSVYQSYIDKNKRKEKWGSDFEKNENKISAIVDEVIFSYLSYENEPAMTVYHNISSGVTESAENVWGKKFPYLISVVSDGDKLSPEYFSDNKLSIEKFNSILKTNEINEDSEVKITRFKSGYANEVVIEDVKISGTDFRKKFSLRSTDFDININKENVVISCRGNGHFVGMSQYGADYMARQGAGYDEILYHYYPGTDLKILKS